MTQKTTNIYPKLVIKNNTHPNRLLAFPFVGIVIRCILLIPVFIVSILYGLGSLLYLLIIPFAILFTGNYPEAAYNYMVGVTKFGIKMSLYLFGLTDIYPGFGLDDKGLFQLDIKKPSHPSRLLAFPLFGFFIRIIILLPYIYYVWIMQKSSSAAVVFSWFAVLIKGKYPESLYEFNRDFIRLTTAQSIFMGYLSDTYPSFRISMNHKTIKIILIILGVLLALQNMIGQFNRPQQHIQYNRYEKVSQSHTES